jgi:hypothetical protein
VIAIALIVAYMLVGVIVAGVVLGIPFVHSVEKRRYIRGRADIAEKKLGWDPDETPLRILACLLWPLLLPVLAVIYIAQLANNAFKWAISLIAWLMIRQKVRLERANRALQGERDP